MSNPEIPLIFHEVETILLPDDENTKLQHLDRQIVQFME